MHFPSQITYSEKFTDGIYEYRNIGLPKTLFKKIKQGRLLEEKEWRALGVQGTTGWQHFETYKPEPFILMMRKKI